MALVTCGGADVLRGRISLPLCGVWFADLLVDAKKAQSGSVTIKAQGGLELKGTVYGPSGVEIDTAHVRVVGGAGGMWKPVSKAFRQAKLRDPLDAIVRAASETRSSTVAPELLAVSLTEWVIAGHRASAALDDLADAAARALGGAVNWRLLADGSVWMGIESWSAAKLPKDADILKQYPAERRYVIGASTPALLPGVDLDGVGKVRAVDHFIEPSSIRSWAWI